MDTRREFLKKAGLLTGMTGMNSLIPDSIRKALAIDPNPGSTWQDAEHIVILMQENRSFDHCFGTLRGVRGFNDPRAIQLPNGNPVWLQSNAKGETYAPFHLNIKDTKSTWMSSLPHSWKNQVNARNDGKYDQWLNEKKSSTKEFADMPLTLGYYYRQDIPFYYELADGFTICDQHFCSALTGTNPNRLYFWSGTIREEQNESSRAHVWNEDVDYAKLHWKTFPEILEENGINWKFYQNAISLNVGFQTEEDAAWLSNFQDNPLEFFSQYHVHLDESHLAYFNKLVNYLPTQISTLQKQAADIPITDPAKPEMEKTIKIMENYLREVKLELNKYNREQFDGLSSFEKSVHKKAFESNSKDPDYLSLELLTYNDNGTERKIKLPKGDILHQFRKDVETGNLPTVSWLVAPENFSDHPSSAWYGAWYVSEVMDILTKNPEVWKKTIFILTYDENDGYFDHVPPFVAPHSGKKETGMASAGIDTSVEYVTLEQEKERDGFPEKFNRESPIGLGYRVPLIIASPWSRGGYVNSEIFDHTSTLQFLEVFLNQKTGKSIHAANISNWRRTVCGDLSSAFRPSDANKSPVIDFIERKTFMESIYNTKFKKLPSDYKSLNPGEIVQIKKNPNSSPYFPQQEKGTRPSCGLRYQLYADGYIDKSKKSIDIRFEASNQIFGMNSNGAPFNVYAPGRYRKAGMSDFENLRTWAFAVKSPDQFSYSWPLEDFDGDDYHLQVYGPNGFFRELRGSGKDPDLNIQCVYQSSLTNKMKLTGNIVFKLINSSGIPFQLMIIDNAYGAATYKKLLLPSNSNSGNLSVPLDLYKHFGWYDFTIKIMGNELFERRYAGRVETGEDGFSDPFMGRLI